MDSGHFIQAAKTRKVGGAAGSCPGAEQRIHWAAHCRPATLEHVGVDLRGLDVVVAHQLLYRADVVTRLQQVGGKAVPQGVRRRSLANTGRPYRLLERPLEPRRVDVMLCNRRGGMRRMPRIRRHHAEPRHNAPREPLGLAFKSFILRAVLSGTLEEGGCHAARPSICHSA